MPHGCCYNWQPEIVWTNILADSAICLSYYSIPLVLFAFVRKRKDIPFNAIFIIFGIFIMACGTTHLLEVVNVYTPLYHISALVKIITAVVSVTAVCMLVPILPQALALPSLKVAHDRLEKTSKELQRSNVELERFAFVASHDLQEPLRMISLNIDLLNTKFASQFDQASLRCMERVLQGTERMRQMIASVLSLSQIDQVPLPTVTVDANLALADAITNLAVAIGSSHAHITHDPLPSARCDRSQLSQVFQNLISNAIKYRRPDLPRPEIHVSSINREGNIIFSVKDNGIGIESADFQRIFVFFQRIHDRTHVDGHGLGLASAKKIVERHGGTIWVESQLGTGSTFLFSIPTA